MKREPIIKTLNDGITFAEGMVEKEPHKKELILSLFNVMVIRTLKENIKSFTDLMDCIDVLILEEEGEPK